MRPVVPDRPFGLTFWCVSAAVLAHAAAMAVVVSFVLWWFLAPAAPTPPAAARPKVPRPAFPVAVSPPAGQGARQQTRRRPW